MTSEARRFPFGLTLAALIVFVLCCALGTWQLQRAAWKAHMLAAIAQRRDAPPQPIGPVLARAAGGADVGFTPVTAICLPSSPAATSYRAGSDSEGWIWRAAAPCRLAGAAYPSIIVDRGSLDASRGSTTPPTVVLPPPRDVAGVLRPAPKPGDRLPPYVLVAERETPAPPGVTPTKLTDVPENLQYVGAYAVTWFGLAGVLAGVYAALLWRRLRTP